jgi:hypothetical protein
MTEPVESLILDLLEWVGRTYHETLEAWRTTAGPSKFRNSAATDCSIGSRCIHETAP